jgi:hypothetical protein
MTTNIEIAFLRIRVNKLEARAWKLETALGMIIQSGSSAVPDYIRQIAIEALREDPNEAA